MLQAATARAEWGEPRRAGLRARLVLSEGRTAHTLLLFPWRGAGGGAGGTGRGGCPCPSPSDSARASLLCPPQCWHAEHVNMRFVRLSKRSEKNFSKIAVKY